MLPAERRTLDILLVVRGLYPPVLKHDYFVELRYHIQGIVESRGPVSRQFMWIYGDLVNEWVALMHKAEVARIEAERAKPKPV